MDSCCCELAALFVVFDRPEVDGSDGGPFDALALAGASGRSSNKSMKSIIGGGATDERDCISELLIVFELIEVAVEYVNGGGGDGGRSLTGSSTSSRNGKYTGETGTYIGGSWLIRGDWTRMLFGPFDANTLTGGLVVI